MKPRRVSRVARPFRVFSLVCLAVPCGWFIAFPSAVAGDWPQYRGLNHDGISSETIRTNWSSQSPRQIWKVPLTAGFSSLAVSQGKAFTLVRRMVGGQDQEVCVALSADTGDELWAAPVGPADYDSGGDTAGGGDGPRSTPSVDGDKVYVLSAYLVLYCLEAQTGSEVWKKDLLAEYGGTVIAWQNAASPLIEGDYIFVNCNGAGQKLLALRKQDGSQVWRAVDEAMTHATPVIATIGGVRQVIFLTQTSLVAVAPESGVQLWRYAFGGTTSIGASPVVGGDIVYCSAGYAKGAAAVRIVHTNNTFRATELWRKPGALQNHWMTPVYHQGYLYGLYGNAQYGTAPLKCVELASGREMWSTNGFGQGGLLLASGQMVVLSERGELVLAKATPTAYTQVGRFQAVGGKCWNAPALSNGRLYARSTTDGVCLDVAIPKVPLKLQAVTGGPPRLFQLQIGSSDGSALPPDRLTGTELLATSDLTVGLSNWTRLNLSPLPTNGLFQWQDPESSDLARRFYLLRDPP